MHNLLLLNGHVGFHVQYVFHFVKDHPKALLEYYTDDSKCSHLIVSPEYEKILRPLAEQFKIPLIIITHKDIELGKTKQNFQQELDVFSKNSDDALILYTSGTTGKPKVKSIQVFVLIICIKIFRMLFIQLLHYVHKWMQCYQLGV